MSDTAPRREGAVSPLPSQRGRGRGWGYGITAIVIRVCVRRAGLFFTALMRRAGLSNPRLFRWLVTGAPLRESSTASRATEVTHSEDVPPADQSSWFSARARGSRLEGVPRDPVGAVELTPLPPLTDDDVAIRSPQTRQAQRTTPWRLSDELPNEVAAFQRGDDPADHAQEYDETSTVRAPLLKKREQGPSENEAVERSLVRELLEPRAAQVSGHRRSLGDGEIHPVIESWRDPDRRGWLLLSIGASIVLFLVITSSVVRSVEVKLAREATDQAPLASAAEKRIARVAPLNTAEPPPQPAPWRESLPIALGGVWLLGAWIVDHEARRALVVRGTWRDQPGLAYRLIALLVVTPIMVGGVILAAWGTVNVLVFYGRSGDVASGSRAVAVFAAIVLSVLVFRLPIASVARALRAWVGNAIQQVSRGSRSRHPRRGVSWSRKGAAGSNANERSRTIDDGASWRRRRVRTPVFDPSLERRV